MHSANLSFIIIIILGLLFLSGIFYFMNNGNEINKENTETPVLEEPQAIFKTNFGDIGVVFFTGEAPRTVENFINLAKGGFYDGTRFHRIIKDFMIQGGDPFSRDVSLKNRWGTGGPGYTFPDEINREKLVRGVLAMANAGPDTNGSQFFIITAEKTPWLDGMHTAFGKVVSGLDVVMTISKLETENDRPLKEVIVEKVIVK